MRQRARSKSSEEVRAASTFRRRLAGEKGGSDEVSLSFKGEQFQGFSVFGAGAARAPEVVRISKVKSGRPHYSSAVLMAMVMVVLRAEILLDKTPLRCRELRRGTTPSSAGPPTSSGSSASSAKLMASMSSPSSSSPLAGVASRAVAQVAESPATHSVVAPASTAAATCASLETHCTTVSAAPLIPWHRAARSRANTSKSEGRSVEDQQVVRPAPHYSFDVGARWARTDARRRCGRRSGRRRRRRRRRATRVTTVAPRLRPPRQPGTR